MTLQIAKRDMITRLDMAQATTTTDIWMRNAAADLEHRATIPGQTENIAYRTTEVDARVALGQDWADSYTKYFGGGAPAETPATWSSSITIGSYFGMFRGYGSGYGSISDANAFGAATITMLDGGTFDILQLHVSADLNGLDDLRIRIPTFSANWYRMFRQVTGEYSVIIAGIDAWLEAEDTNTHAFDLEKV